MVLLANSKPVCEQDQTSEFSTSYAILADPVRMHDERL